MRRLFALPVAAVALLALAPMPPAHAEPTAKPAVGHVFIIVLENKAYDTTWGPSPGSAYLGTELRAKGNLLTQYYGTSHNSLGNYITMVSGQAASVLGQADCLGVPFGLCTYGSGVDTIAGQLTAAGRTWRGYMEDMVTPCQHPAASEVDNTQSATPSSQYAARHNPFVYFQSITDDTASCAEHVVNLNALDSDLASIDTTRNLTFVTPDLCHDGHDDACVDGGPGGYAGIDQFLRAEVPKILASPAYQADGLLLVAFDESELPDAASCCYQPGPLAGIVGPGGGRTGLLAISPFIEPGTEAATPYNHYSLLRSLEDLFALPHLGGAGNAQTQSFGADVYNSTTSRGSEPVSSSGPGAPIGETPAAGDDAAATGAPTTALAALAAAAFTVALLGHRAIKRGRAT